MGIKPEMKFERLRLILRDGDFIIRVEGGDFDWAEIVTLHCGDSLDFTLPLGGAIPVIKDKTPAVQSTPDNSG